MHIHEIIELVHHSVRVHSDNLCLLEDGSHGSALLD